VVLQVGARKVLGKCFQGVKRVPARGFLQAGNYARHLVSIQRPVLVSSVLSETACERRDSVISLSLSRISASRLGLAFAYSSRNAHPVEIAREAGDDAEPLVPAAGPQP